MQGWPRLIPRRGLPLAAVACSALFLRVLPVLALRTPSGFGCGPSSGLRPRELSRSDSRARQPGPRPVRGYCHSDEGRASRRERLPTPPHEDRMRVRRAVAGRPPSPRAVRRWPIDRDFDAPSPRRARPLRPYVCLLPLRIKRSLFNFAISLRDATSGLPLAGQLLFLSWASSSTSSRPSAQLAGLMAPASCSRPCSPSWSPVSRALQSWTRSNASARRFLAGAKRPRAFFVR